MTFHERVRSLLEQKGLSLALLATTAELDPSIVSRLLSENAGMRRPPRIEHVFAIARALGVSPGELVSGTTAEGILSEWVSREELERESNARLAAQTTAASLRTDLAGSNSQIAILNTTIQQLMRRIADADTAVHRERVARSTSDALRDAAIIERDRALVLATTNYHAWNNARARILQLQRAMVQANNSAKAGWAAALIGGVAAAILAGEANTPPPKKTRSSTRRTRRLPT